MFQFVNLPEDDQPREHDEVVTHFVSSHKPPNPNTNPNPTLSSHKPFKNR